LIRGREENYVPRYQKNDELVLKKA
jgi:hypothetical protein